MVNWKRLNINGPYSMGVWKSIENLSVGDQESMAGRAEIQLEVVRKFIVSNFSKYQIQKMTIVDIGCNDGWLLHHLSDLPFKKMTGVEPRAKNNKKRIVVREELKIKSNIEFINGDIAALKNRKFDIVLCTGVLYHVESIPSFLKDLKKISKSWVFIESRVINQYNVGTEIINQAELIDLPYKFGQATHGISVHKLESNYSDGSSHENIVVSLPSTEAIVMYLQTMGFEKIKIELSAKEYRDKLIRKDRQLDGVCISAKLNNNESFKNRINHLKNNASALEDIYQNVTLPMNLLNLLIDIHTKGSVRIFAPSINRLILKWMNPSNFQNSKLQNKLVKKLKLSHDQSIIFKDIKFSPKNKIDFERAKISFGQNDFIHSMSLTNGILNSPNADWRSVYRSLYLQYRIGKLSRNHKLIRESRENLRLCNENYYVR